MASKALLMEHPSDPRADILERVKAYIDHVRVTGPDVLIGVYMRPEKTAGGVWLSERAREEDIFQGKVGVVLKMGPLAFVEDGKHTFGDAVPKIGDWVVFRVSDGMSLRLGEQACRQMQDVAIRMILDGSPDIIL